MTARRQGVSCLLAPFLRPPYSYRRTSLVKEAEESILKRRPIQLRQAFRDADLADWVHKTARTTLPPPLPEAVYSLGSLREVPREHPHRQRGQYVYLCAHKQGQSRPRELSSPDITTDKYEAIAWSLPFCSVCRERAPASILLQ